MAFFKENQTIDINLGEILSEVSSVDKSTITKIINELGETVSHEEEIEVEVDIESVLEEFGSTEMLEAIDLSDIEDYMTRKGYFIFEEYDKPSNNLFNQMKINYFFENLDKISLEDLEKLVNSK